MSSRKPNGGKKNAKGRSRGKEVEAQEPQTASGVCVRGTCPAQAVRARAPLRIVGEGPTTRHGAGFRTVEKEGGVRYGEERALQKSRAEGKSKEARQEVVRLTRGHAARCDLETEFRASPVRASGQHVAAIRTGSRGVWVRYRQKTLRKEKTR